MNLFLFFHFVITKPKFKWEKKRTHQEPSLLQKPKLLAPVGPDPKHERAKPLRPCLAI